MCIDFRKTLHDSKSPPSHAIVQRREGGSKAFLDNRPTCALAFLWFFLSSLHRSAKSRVRSLVRFIVSPYPVCRAEKFVLSNTS